jgi:hypothetical protein
MPIRRVSDWLLVKEEVEQRHALLIQTMTKLEDVTDDKNLQLTLATTDIFVEKAQFHLTRRATNKYWLAALLSLAALGLIIVFLCLVWPFLLRDASEYKGLEWPATLLLFSQKILVGGFMFAAIYFCAALARAFMHEATILLNRRHAIRFGRLVVYLSRGRGVEVKTLMDAFGWNLESKSAFLGIKPEVMSRGTLAQIGDIIERGIKAARGAN